MATEYTPTVEQARRAYVTGMRQAFIASAGEHEEEFDRFIARVWDEGFDAGERDVMQHETFNEPCIRNPYRIEKGGE